jgi:hypothetical protein
MFNVFVGLRSNRPISLFMETHAETKAEVLLYCFQNNDEKQLERFCELTQKILEWMMLEENDQQQQRTNNNERYHRGVELIL